MIGHQNSNDPFCFGQLSSVIMYAMTFGAEENLLDYDHDAEFRDISEEKEESGVRWKGWR
jgi:hypothetical protein